MLQCPPGPAFDVAATSGFYAQMAGLLAGFAFSTITFLLRPRPKEHRPDGVILTLLVAFVSLIVSTLTYSVLAGEESAYGRATAQELMDGLPFALAIMMLFHGVGQLIAASPHMEQVAIRTSRFLTAFVTPALAMFYLYSGAIDTEHARIATLRTTDPGYCGDLEPITSVGLVLLVTLILALLGVWFIQPKVAWQHWAFRKRSAVPLTVLWASVVSAVLVGLVTLQGPTFLLPAWALIAILASAWVLLAALALLIVWAQPIAHIPDQRESQAVELEPTDA